MKFEKKSPSVNVSVEFSNEVTWMEATDNFISFLHASGYVFDPVDVGIYVIDNYHTGVVEDCSGCSNCKCGRG
jgi:hypothetical protein